MIDASAFALGAFLEVPQVVAAAAVRAPAAIALEPAPPATPASALPPLPPVEVRAEDVTLDARTGDLTVKGGVAIDAPPFFLRADELAVKRSTRGVRVDGRGEVLFCPCLETPLSVRFDGALVGPPADLVVDSPVLAVFGVPVFWAPRMWLRAPSRPGLLPPEIAYRGPDGLYLGLGAHVPVPWGDARRGLDVGAGAYVRGGAAAELMYRGLASTARVRVDHLETTGLLVDARGHHPVDERDRSALTVAWDVDALRGERAVRATTSLETAARPFDRAAGTATFFAPGVLAGLSVRAVDARGAAAGRLGAYGPAVFARASGSVLGSFVYDASIDGAVLADEGRASLGHARAEAGLGHAAHVGPVGLATTIRGGGSVAAQGRAATSDYAAAARVSAALPLARTFAAAGAGGPWFHRIEPQLSVAAAVADGRGLVAYVPGRGAGVVQTPTVLGEAALASFGGRLGPRLGGELTLALALVASEGRDVRPALRARTMTELGFAALALDYARTGPSPTAPTEPSGDVLFGRMRLGARDGLQLGATVAGRVGSAEPLEARLLFDAAIEQSAAWLLLPGWTGGVRLRVPVGRALALNGGADASLDTPTLLGARGGLELRDPCGCVALRVQGAHRIGRPGVDVWMSVELSPR